MSKPNARSVRSKQTAILRYIASTDINTTSADLGLSTKTLRRFVSAKPETVRKHPERFTTAMAANPKQTAKDKGQKLVPYLSGERLKRAYRVQNSPEYISPKGRKIKVDTDWTKRSIRYAQVAHTRYQVMTPEGRKYREIVPSNRKNLYAQRQILSGLQGENTHSLINKWRSGEWSYNDALSAVRQLWSNSDAAFTPEMEARYFGD